MIMLLDLVARMFDKSHADPNHIVFVSLTEKVVPCFMVDEYRYELVIRLNGKRVVIKRANMDRALTWTQYNEMVKEALPLGVDHMVKNLGYRVTVDPKFTESTIRRKILSGLVKRKDFKVNTTL